MLANVSKEQILQTSRQKLESKSVVAVVFIPNKAFAVLEVSDIDRAIGRRRASNVAQVLSLKKMSSAMMSKDLVQKRISSVEIPARGTYTDRKQSQFVWATLVGAWDLSQETGYLVPLIINMCHRGGLKKLTKRNQIKKKYDAILLYVSSHRISWEFSSLLVSIQSSQSNAALAMALSSVVIKHWRWVKVLHVSLHTCHHHLWRPEFSGSPFYFLLIWIWGSKESHSLHHLKGLRIQRGRCELPKIQI